jgi:hypothetical protein
MMEMQNSCGPPGAWVCVPNPPVFVRGNQIPDISVTLAALPDEARKIMLRELPPARLVEVLGFVNPATAAHMFLMLGVTVRRQSPSVPFRGFRS